EPPGPDARRLDRVRFEPRDLRLERGDEFRRERQVDDAKAVLRRVDPLAGLVVDRLADPERAPGSGREVIDFERDPLTEPQPRALVDEQQGKPARGVLLRVDGELGRGT